MRSHDPFGTCRNWEKIVTPEGEVVCADKVSSESAEGFGYISHFATCKARNR